jgi:uncharacterized protein YhdP
VLSEKSWGAARNMDEVAKISQAEFNRKIQELVDSAKKMILSISELEAYWNTTNDWLQYRDLRNALYDFIEDTENNLDEAQYLCEEQVKVGQA